MNIEIAAQRAFFESGRTRPLQWRLEQLGYLKKAIRQYEHCLLYTSDAADEL